MKAEVWLYPGESANWHFVSVPKNTSAEIRERFGKHSRGFGSLPVKATIGKTDVSTSVFFDGKSGTYILPLKASVRKKEGIVRGDTIRCVLELQVGATAHNRQKR